VKPSSCSIAYNAVHSMEQRFTSRNYSVADFEGWNDKGELTLAPKFQRRDVWSDKARSYLIDTIVRGKPIPKIYMRQETNATTRRTIREIVDGQQRLRTVLSFVKDGFKISKTHNKECGGRLFSSLSEELQGQVLRYEFVVDLLQDMPDADVYDVFARINTYSVVLKPQELRNARWFGDFKTAVYSLANEFVTFWEENKIFTSKQMLRMAEAELVSELLMAISSGIREGQKTVIDNFYEKNDDVFPRRATHEKRFRQTMDGIGAIFGEDLAQSQFRATRLFYPLFCAVYHLKFGLPKFTHKRVTVRVADYPKAKVALLNVDALLDRIKEAEDNDEEIELTRAERRFYDAYTEHWVHADKRSILTGYLCDTIIAAIEA
jgi:hypothetical protein